MQQLTGINAIVTQIGSVVSQHNPTFGYYTPLIFNGVQTIATFFAIVAINNHGRRSILLAGNGLFAAYDIILGILFIFIQDSDVIFWIVFVILIFYNITYGVTLGPAVWLYVPEIIPAKIVPFATTLNWLGCSIAILILPVLNANLGDFAVFFLFGAVTIITFIINVIFLK